jgi:hypothetical protein
MSVVEDRGVQVTYRLKGPSEQAIEHFLQHVYHSFRAGQSVVARRYGVEIIDWRKDITTVHGHDWPTPR